MKKIAVTGNIAAGKSAAEKIILSMGYKLIDADKICHDLFEDETVIRKIINLFVGFYILDENQKPDRNKIGKIVFSDKKYKTKLEKIIHPIVKIKINEFFEENESENLLFVSVPLLFETGMEAMFDKVIFISADKKIRLERLIKRNNYSEEYANIRINSQQDETEKIQKSHYVIENNGSLDELESTVKEVVDKLLNLCQ